MIYWLYMSIIEERKKNIVNTYIEIYIQRRGSKQKASLCMCKRDRERQRKRERDREREREIHGERQR